MKVIDVDLASAFIHLDLLYPFEHSFGTSHWVATMEDNDWIFEIYYEMV